MAWNDAPPSKDELKSTQGSWADAPPTKDELSGDTFEKEGIINRIKGIFSSEGRAKLQAAMDRAKKAQGEPKTGRAQSELEGFGNGATLGYLPHLQAAAEPVTTAIGNAVTGADVEPDSYVESRDRNIARQKLQAEEHPGSVMAGKLAGGLATTIAAAPLMGETAALSGLQKLEHAGKIGAGVGALQNPGDKEGVVDDGGQLADRVTNAGIGAGIGIGTQGGLEGLSGARTLGDLMKIAPKANADQIKAAAEALGIKPTAGMTMDSPAVQSLESSLHQSKNTLGGRLMQRETGPVGKGMTAASDKLFQDANGLTPDQAGQQAKKQIGSSVDTMFDPHRQTFQDLQQYTKDINAPESSRNAVSRNIMNIPEVSTFEGDAAAGVAKSVTKALENDPSADMIKKLKTMVGKKAASADPDQSGAMWQIYAKLSRLEENTIKRGVINSARTGGEGNTIAEGMLGQLKGAKQGWKSGLDKIGEFSDASGLGDINSPDHLMTKIGGIQNEKMQTRLFNPNDNEMTTSLKNTFPEAGDTLRGAELTRMQNAASDGGVNTIPSKVLSSTAKNTPEANQHLFGQEGTEKLGNLRAVDASLPDKVGPSGTNQAIEVKDSWSPLTQGRSLLQYGQYKAMTSDKLQKAAEFLSKLPQAQNLMQTNPEAFNAMVLNFAERSGGTSGVRAADNGPSRSDQAHYDPGMEKAAPIDDAKNRFLEGN